MNPSDVLTGFSLALYASWYFYAPARLLVDCGEGCATTLGSKCGAIERVLLTHGHIDHIAGLPGLLWARSATLGAGSKPLEVWFPRGDGFISDLREFLARVAERVPLAVTWHELDAGDEVPLKGGRRAVAFATRHLETGVSLGYKIIETRRRLRPEHAHLDGEALRERAQNGTIGDVMDSCEAIKIAFCGDSLPVEAGHVAGSEILLHEATFLDARDRRKAGHSTLDEALEVGVRACPKLLVLIHPSTRYGRTEIEAAALKAARERALACPVWCFYRDHLWPVYQPESASFVQAIS